MPFCDSCGQQIEEKQKFCPNCGARNEAAFQGQATQAPPPPPPSEKSEADLPPPPPPEHKSEVPVPKKVIDIEVDQQDIDQAKEKAKRGLSAAFGFAKRGLSKGAEIAGKGIEAARETIDERRSASSQDAPKSQGEQRFCPNCGEAVPGSGKFCNHCGHKLE
ncbi:MAG TPA: zinc-ribbon domain-containing protein [Candidatus Desulfaltia sp.]|nr:zinc-ribbon domain-containing protein [Candidatus Desulfaltia sp.]